MVYLMHIHKDLCTLTYFYKNKYVFLLVAYASLLSMTKAIHDTFHLFGVCLMVSVRCYCCCCCCFEGVFAVFWGVGVGEGAC